MPREEAFHRLIIVSYPRQDKRSKVNGCVIQQDFMLLTVRIKEDIVKNIRKCSFFSIILDTTQDIPKKDQLSIIIRYVTTDVIDSNEPDNIRINETFLGFIEAANQTAKSLESDVLNFLNALDINLTKCRGQGYDGAANMSGAYGGLQKLRTNNQEKLRSLFNTQPQSCSKRCM
ncbi:hypothetical protein TNCT_447301 [Trichonephila clavata]|uniref:DUF4371 domain-containing protein n=1 Tax=Trichonephila clavata TaxID=2740835 RepID=A0A8X6KBK6_TRICU|nr:hypothetical protein TNCT_447301 [Trichonephila clavata]